VDLGADTTLCADDEVSLVVSDWETVLWSNGSNAPAIQAGPGTWWVQVIDGTGCVAADTVVIAEDLCDVPIGNTFTPNGDGVNDVMTLTDPGGRSLSFNVYNRWGQLVFSRSAQVVQWDGRSGTTAEVLPAGVYYYVLERLQADGRTDGRSGYIQLIR
jgi:gliding motility-associated-like protein